MTSPARCDVIAEDARRLTDRIKVAVEGTWHLIEEAYLSRAWSALGYTSWDDYCTREFGTSRLRLPREDRQEVVASLREIGMSTRAIAAGIGVQQKTVVNDLQQVKSLTSPAADGSSRHDLDAVLLENGIDPARLEDDEPDDGPEPAPRPVIGRLVLRARSYQGIGLPAE